ncbi:MAG: dUTP diphosphatase [Oscillospiraceae bacterium]|nr:dUTP diphosphatase [Oscillospiraceae bacterium]
MNLPQSQLEIKVKKMREDAILPLRATGGAAAADLYAVCPTEGVVILPGQRVTIPTGVAIQLPSPAYVALVFARSGLGIKKGIALSNGVGVIDSDYRGEICVGLINLSDEPYTVQNGERIAQLAVMPVCVTAFTQVEQLEDTARGANGFGSTGSR